MATIEKQINTKILEYSIHINDSQPFITSIKID